MAKRLIMITGGQRCGKSVYAEKMALSLSDSPVYMATSRIWDEDFRQRVLAHQQRRGPQWTNVEEEKYLSRHDVGGRVVLVDCCTLWATNFFYDTNDVQKSFEAIRTEFDRLTSQDATFIFVTNEIGLGGVSGNDVQRHFTDLLGMVNQHVASCADDVYLIVSGIEVKIK